MGQSINDARLRAAAAAAIGSAKRALERADEIASFTARITRQLASRSLVAATERVAGWIRDAALEVQTDPISNP